MEGRGDHILLPSVIPAQVQGCHNTMRSTLMIGYPFRRLRGQTHYRKALGIPSSLWRLWGKTPVGRSVRRLDAKRNLELVNAEFRTTADANQVPESV